MNLKYESVVTGRKNSLFAADIQSVEKDLSYAIKGSRIAVVGAAGSIGSAVVKTLLRFSPAKITLIDLSENNLVELVRNLRSTPEIKLPDEFVTLPIGMGSNEFYRFFAENKPYDYFFNLSAIKHVRSEKDVYCLIRMIQTNVTFMYEFLDNYPHIFRKVFSVSSDKAANPANLMGATKMAMELSMLHQSDKQSFSTARFANVAFSDGSLPFGFLRRIECGQPLSAPRDVRRYFISHQEAGELCVLSAITGDNRDIYFPKLAEDKDEKTFSDIAVDLLNEMGYEPFLCDSESEAKERAEELIISGKWPCFFFDSDTTGEKSFEEFFTSEEKLDMERFSNLGIVCRENICDSKAFQDFISFFENAKNNNEINKSDYVDALKELVPTLQHHETGKNLDQKM